MQSSADQFMTTAFKAATDFNVKANTCLSIEKERMLGNAVSD